MRKQMIQNSGLSYQAPAQLEARIRKSLRPERSQSNWLAWGAVAAAILVASTLSIRLTQHLGAKDQMAEQMISSHVRAMMTGHTTDVVSTDRHTVKPWFNGKLDFSPPVVDLATQQFPLVGGRVDYVEGRVAAALVYQRRKHVIDLFIWPTRPEDASGTEASKGFSVIRWQDSGMSFAAVSDLNQTELEQFKSLLSRK
jgi:anti-sigma factor RsiW